MSNSNERFDPNLHKKIAIQLFHHTWDLIENRHRNEEETNEMIHAAHASRFHWGIVGEPVHFARGEWQISRVYALAGRFEPSSFHARKSLDLCLANNLGPFDTGFAYEAMARAYAVEGNLKKRDEYIEMAKLSAENVENQDDQLWLIKNIDTIKSLSLPTF
ncbi:MAG TPA: hypothetical protein VFK37_01545 [Bacillales bacterium]|nr:hypothetical protein [Bacillales bacterium]